MRVGVVQARAIKGDVARNLERHLSLLAVATANGADLVVFPELSLTGYEPTLARELATTQDDGRFAPLQAYSDSQEVVIGAGMPLYSGQGITISMLLFQPHRPRQAYTKRYLHPDEEPFFASGRGIRGVSVKGKQVAFAICYELSVQDHAEQARKDGADLYLASVAKSPGGVAAATQRLASVAKQHCMDVLMANCVGPADNFTGAGQTAAWTPLGTLVAQLDSTCEGVLLYDTHTSTVTLEVV